MTHQLNMCCGTTCDKKVNLDYVKRLELADYMSAITNNADAELLREAVRRLG